MSKPAMKSLVVLVTLVLLLGQNADGLDLPLSLADELDGLPDGFLDTALFSFLGETFSDFTFPSFGSPDDSPTPQPTSSPTNMPTPSPTTATEAPTDSTLIVDPHPVPSNPPSKYFNYDDDSDYGPNNWKNVDTSEHWLKEFGPNGFGPWANQIDYDPSDNQCDRNVRRQSPKDLSSTIECDAIHEIRTWCGAYGVSDNNYEPKILPHKLSLVMNRRLCLDVENNRRCRFSQPPRADYPRYASAGTSYADMMNYDIKVPSEHTIEGLRFDAEVQMFHVHPVGGRLSSVGVLIEASDDDDAFNFEFQDILDQFQELYDLHEPVCSFRRKLQSLQDASAFEFPEDLRLELENASYEFQDYEMPDDLKSLIEGARNSLQEATNPPTTPPTAAPTGSPTNAPTDSPTKKPTNRPTPNPTNFSTPKPTTTQKRKFNPYSEALMPTIFFYRYNGSITEPPCKDITWWVMSQPMKIARGQLLQLQNIMFTNVDPDKQCQPSSVHNAAQSVARPTFPLGTDREIQGCTAGSYKSDFEKFAGIARKCRL